MKLLIVDNKICVDNFPYKPSQYYTKKIIEKDEIQCIVKGFVNPTICTKKEEIIIFDYSQEDVDTLDGYAITNNIEKVQYFDVWSNIFEPFLDTETSKIQMNKIERRLDYIGLDKDKIQNIQNEIKEMMIEYNFKSGLWEWINLNMYDLFDACIGKLNKIKMTEEYFKEYYWNVMEIAQKGKNVEFSKLEFA